MEDSEKALKYIEPKAVGQVWNQVLPQLEALLRICPDDFTSHDVYWYLRENKASLFLLPEGFMVVEIATEPFRQNKTLCIWLMYWKQAEANQDWLLQQCEAMAKHHDCVRIHFKSPRMGWMKKAKGFKLKMITWEHLNV